MMTVTADGAGVVSLMALSISFGELTIFRDGGPTDVGRDELRNYLDREEVAINIELAWEMRPPLCGDVI